MNSRILFFTDLSPPSVSHMPVDHEADKQLADWLREQGADADTIDKVGITSLSCVVSTGSDPGAVF